MSKIFVIDACLITLYISLTLVTAIKLWQYGNRDLLLVLSPLLCLIIVIGLPIGILNFVFFHKDKLPSELTKEYPTTFRRIILVFNMIIWMFQALPIILAVISRKMAAMDKIRFNFNISSSVSGGLWELFQSRDHMKHAL